MSNLPPEELNEVEEVVEPVPIGLPKSMQNLSRQQMGEYIANALREYKPKEQPDGQPDPRTAG